MLNIRYNAENFPFPYSVASNGSLSISWGELIWAAISVGRAESSHLTRYGRFSVFEIIYRVSILYANLCEKKILNNRYLVRSMAYERLDPSEKGAISYFLGLTLAKVFSTRVLNTPWLMHLDVYRDALQPTLNNTRSRPDLVGKDVNDQWIVMEAKGRTNRFDQSALLRAKNQAQQVLAISGERPILNVGVQVYFDGDVLQIEAIDPPADEGNGINLPISSDDFYSAYYGKFEKWLAEGSIVTYSDIEYRIRTISEIDVSIGIVNQFFQNKEWLSQYRQKLFLRNENNVFESTDGMLVEVGALWSQKNMSLEPRERI